MRSGHTYPHLSAESAQWPGARDGMCGAIAAPQASRIGFSLRCWDVGFCPQRVAILVLAQRGAAHSNGAAAAPPHGATPPSSQRAHRGATQPAVQSSITGACSVAATYKPPMLVPRVRLPACAYVSPGYVSLVFQDAPPSMRRKAK